MSLVGLMGCASAGVRDSAAKTASARFQCDAENVSVSQVYSGPGEFNYRIDGCGQSALYVCERYVNTKGLQDLYCNVEPLRGVARDQDTLLSQAQQ
jgi:hypothetical protein